jgi:hypothetical protein
MRISMTRREITANNWFYSKAHPPFWRCQKGGSSAAPASAAVGSAIGQGSTSTPAPLVGRPKNWGRTPVYDERNHLDHPPHSPDQLACARRRPANHHGVLIMGALWGSGGAATWPLHRRPSRGLACVSDQRHTSLNRVGLMRQRRSRPYAGHNRGLLPAATPDVGRWPRRGHETLGAGQ